MTSGVLRSTGLAVPARPVTTGRPQWWLLVLALGVAVVVTADVLSRGPLERLDLRASEVVGEWGLRDSAAFPFVWVVTQVGGRVTILAVLVVLVGYLVWRRRAWLPLLRVLIALALLTVVVYGIKHGTGRTAPGHPGEFLFHPDGASFPSGHVANAVLMWGVARWQAVEYGLPRAVQRVLWVLSVLGPLVTGVAMVSLDFHWVTDAVVGGAVGILLLGVVHALDEAVLSRWVRARGRQTA